MKFIPLIALALLPFSALAQTAPIKPLHPDNVTIIDGKKFFSLATARHMENSSPSPKALSVINNPLRDQRNLANRLPMVTTPATGSTAPKMDASLPWAKSDQPTMPPSASAGLTGAAAQKADLLAIFAPDDHAAARALPTALPTK